MKSISILATLTALNCRLIIPRCLYTFPEIAHIGLEATEAPSQGLAIDTYTYPLSDVDRAVLDEETQGFVRLHVRRGTDRIWVPRCATVVAAQAGDLINEIGVLMQAGKGIKTWQATIHPYPTPAEVIKKAGSLWRIARCSSPLQRLLRWWFAWTA